MLKTSKSNRFKSVAMAAALASVAILPLSAHAAGLGRITVLSALGQPLKAELEVTASKDELSSLTAKLAPAEAFKVAGIEYTSSLSTLRFSREIRERGGKRYIEITTDRPVNEPFIDMLVELSWGSGRLVREYTFLLDPPELAQKAPPAPVAMPETKPVDLAQPQASVPIQAPVQVPAVQPPPARATAPVEARPKDTAPLAKKAAPAATPALRPAPAPSAAPAPTPVAEKPAAAPTRETKSGDTLGKIANEVRPDGVSLDQMLVALFRSNPDAFNGNMNRMSAGKILTVPDAETVRAVDATQAKKEVVAQAADFNAYRRKLADAAATGTAAAGTGGRSAAGKITAKVEDKTPPVASGKDKLEVSRTEGAPAAKADAKGGGKAPLEGRLSALEEDLASRERALREANSRIAQLEKNLSDLKKLAEMKSEAGAALQKQAEAPKPAVVAPPAKPAEVPAKPVEAAAKPPVVAPAPVPTTAPAEPAKEAPKEPAKEALAAKAPEPAVAAPAAPPPKKKVIIPEPEPEPDFIEENGPLVFGGAGVIALLLGYLGFSAYKRKKKAAVAEEPVSEPAPSTNSAFNETAAESIDASQMASSELSVSEPVTDVAGSAVDPLVEADTYLAFGRDSQAEEILLEALKTEPTRHAIHVKLLEIYSARRSTLQFNMLAQELKHQTGGQGPEWERALEMGLALDPMNALYQSGGFAESAEPVAPVEVASVDASTEDTLIIEPEPVAVEPVDTEATMILTAPVTLEEVPAEAPAVAPADEVASFDFDLDLGDPATDATAAPTAAEGAAPDAAAAGNVLDFDLDLGEPESSAAATDTPAEEAPTAEAAASSDSALALDIDFDLELPATEPAADVPVTAEPTADSGDLAALDIDLALDAESPSTAEAEPELPVVNVAEIETPPAGNEIEFALDLELPSVSEPTEAAAAPLEMPALELPQASVEPEMSFDVDLGSEGVSSPALDLGAVDLDLEASATESKQEDAPAELALELPADGGESADTAAATPVEAVMPDDPEAATKLELAIAYEEMGDRDGARELLEEVVKEGSPSQVAAAQVKLANFV